MVFVMCKKAKYSTKTLPRKKRKLIEEILKLESNYVNDGSKGSVDILL